MIKKLFNPLLGAITALLFVGSPHLEGSTPNQEALPGPDELPTAGPSATAVTAHLKCTITELRPGQVLRILDEETEQVHLLEFTPSIPLEAKNKKTFDGRKRLDYEDLAIGQRIKITYKIATNEILKIKVLDQAPVTR
jgi:hypothetical protein